MNKQVDDSNRIKRTLVSVLTSLTRKSIEEAGIVPYLVEQDKLVDLLIKNPDSYQSMLIDGRVDNDSDSTGKMIIKEDILAELDEFKNLDQFDLSFDQMMDEESARIPVFNQVTAMARMFAAYTSNVLTIFDEEYASFLRRYRLALQAAGQELRPVELNKDDFADLERAAKTRLVQGNFITAFAYDRLFNPEVIKPHIIHFPSTDFSLGKRLIESAPKDAAFFTELIKFLVRACYISENQWFDLLSCLIQLAEADPHKFRRTLLVHWIEQDSVFCCNLLQETYDSLRWWTSNQRKDAIEKTLSAIARREFSLLGLKPKWNEE
jgi:hypothetical protein